jgi:hypothetical protein
MIIAPRRRKSRRKSGPESAATESGLQTHPLIYYNLRMVCTRLTMRSNQISARGRDLHMTTIESGRGEVFKGQEFIATFITKFKLADTEPETPDQS